MSVVGQGTSITYVASGVATQFNFPYYFINQNDLLVQSIDPSGNVVTYALNTDYSISGTPNLIGDYDSGANVVFVNPPANGLLIAIIRITQRTQLVDFQDGVAFTAETLNHIIDKLTLMAQENVIPGFKGLALGPPTSAAVAYVQDDWFKNVNQVAGGVWGWVCVTAGNPGTWRAFAPVSLT